MITDLHAHHARHLTALRRSRNTILFYRHATHQLSEFMTLRGEAPVTENVTRSTILEYQTWLREDRQLKPGGEHAALRGLRATFRWAFEEELIPTDPSKRLRLPSLPKEPPPAIQPDQVELCLKMAKLSRHPLRDQAIMLMLFDTGIRRGELIGLHLSDVDLEKGIVTVRGDTSKTGKTRRVPIGIRASRAFARYDRSERRPMFDRVQHAFLTRSGLAMTKDALTFMLQSTSERAGLPRDTCAPHAWRRGFAVGLLRGGADLFALQQILGHSSLEMSKRYVRYLPRDLQDVHLRASPADRL